MVTPSEVHTDRMMGQLEGYVSTEKKDLDKL